MSGVPDPCMLHSAGDKVALTDSKDDQDEMPNSEICRARFVKKMLRIERRFEGNLRMNLSIQDPPQKVSLSLGAN